MIDITHATGQTQILFGVLLLALFATARRRMNTALFPVSVTQELKGFAIFLVLCSHIGNFLVNDHRFLAPLSGLSAVGVDMFLLLSGYGLTTSMLRKPQGIKQFYGRLVKLFVPFWIMLIVFLPLDIFWLHIHYHAGTIVQAVFGIFLTSNLSQDFNAPLWFMTAILLYYMLFPLVFWRKHVWVSALALLAIGTAIVLSKPALVTNVLFLYQVYFVAFPLGMLLAWLAGDKHSAPRRQLGRCRHAWQRLVGFVHTHHIPIKLVGIAGLLVVMGFLYLHGHTDQNASRQFVDLLGVVALMALFMLTRLTFGFLQLLGAYSFEIYLIHWPIISRYTQMYAHLPAWLATLLYLVILIALGYGLQQISNVAISFVTRKTRLSAIESTH
jgi:peptidoglycan/LPS O-acetylase OafA/YrhL